MNVKHHYLLTYLHTHTPEYFVGGCQYNTWVDKCSASHKLQRGRRGLRGWFENGRHPRVFPKLAFPFLETQYAYLEENWNLLEILGDLIVLRDLNVTSFIDSTPFWGVI